MKVCILGNGLTGLVLAKALINKGIHIDVFSSKIYKKKDKSRTLGLSKSNINFFNKYILNIERLLWDIKKIEIYSENLNNEKIIEFQKKNDRLFSVIKNYELESFLISELKKNKLFKAKKFIDDYNSIKNKYDLIINCDLNNKITKNFFYRKFNKNYNSYAYTSVIQHKKLFQNHIASQTFTKKGPIAFLPISEKETSVVYSIKGSNKENVEYQIKKYNLKYEIKKINKINCFELKSCDLRSYYYKNVLAFGDLLHKIHPLAGQGFNMSIRDIKVLLKIINFKIEHGLVLDKSICQEFENQNKHKNLIFSSGIDFVYEFFNLENKIKNKFISKSIKLFGNNSLSNKFFTKFADEGI